MGDDLQAAAGAHTRNVAPQHPAVQAAAQRPEEVVHSVGGYSECVFAVFVLIYIVKYSVCSLHLLYAVFTKETPMYMYSASLTIYTTRFKTRNGSSPENDSLFALRDEMETLFRRWDINIGESRVVGRLGLMMFEFQTCTCSL